LIIGEMVVSNRAPSPDAAATLTPAQPVGAAALHGQARFASPVICTAGMAIVQISLQRYHLWQSIVELTHRALM